MARLKGIVPAVVLASAAIAALAAPAAAWDGTMISDPADGAALATPPARVTLTFARPPISTDARVLVLGPDGRSVNASDTPVAAGRVLTQPVSTRGGGEYTIAYRVVLAGGGLEEGVRRFTLAGGLDPAAPHDHGSGVSGHGHGVDPVSVALLAVDGAALLVVGFLLVVRRRGSPPTAWRLPAGEAATTPDDPERNHHDRPA